LRGRGWPRPPAPGREARSCRSPRCRRGSAPWYCAVRTRGHRRARDPRAATTMHHARGQLLPQASRAQKATPPGRARSVGRFGDLPSQIVQPPLVLGARGSRTVPRSPCATGRGASAATSFGPATSGTRTSTRWRGGRGRQVELLRAPDGSFFLFGPRGTGKSRWLEEHFGGAAATFDLLDEGLLVDLLADPAAFGRSSSPFVARPSSSSADARRLRGCARRTASPSGPTRPRPPGSAR
jgi:hypothetical protein